MPPTSHPLFSLALLTLLAAASSCGSSTPAPDSAAGDTRSRLAEVDEEESADPGTDGASSEASCNEGCARYIAQASRLLARARAAGDAPNVELAFARAGDGYIKAFRGCDLGAGRGQDRGCEGADTVLAGMVEGYERAKRYDGAIFAFLAARDPRWAREGSSLSDKANAELARLAAQAEDRVREQPKARGAANALAAAAYAHLALEEPDAATRLARQHHQRYGRNDRDETTLLAVAIADYHVARGEWQPALAALAPETRPRANTKAPVAVLWHSLRGQALTGNGRHLRARQALTQALKRWRPPTAGKLGDSVGRAKPLPMQGRERVVDAVGAAHFLLGEQLREKAHAEAMPPYRGPATVKGVNEYVQSKVAKWAQKRNTQVLAALEAYREVAQIKPVPPPRWVVAAAAATGESWAEFADGFTAATVPDPVENDEDLRRAWTGATRKAAGPLLDKARRAFEICRKAAHSYRLTDDRSARCEQWLKDHPGE